MKRRILTSVLALALLATASAAHAGYAYDGASCTKNADGSGSCTGSFAGFRNGSNPGDQAEFYMKFFGLTGIGFYASLNGVAYSCNVNMSTTPAWLLSTLMTGRSNFFVAWDSSANCVLTAVQDASWTTTP